MLKTIWASLKTILRAIDIKEIDDSDEDEYWHWAIK